MDEPTFFDLLADLPDYPKGADRDNIILDEDE